MRTILFVLQAVFLYFIINVLWVVATFFPSGHWHWGSEHQYSKVLSQRKSGTRSLESGAFEFDVSAVIRPSAHRPVLGYALPQVKHASSITPMAPEQSIYYTLMFKSYFVCFLSLLCSSRLHLFDQKHRGENSNLLQFLILVSYFNILYFCAEFSLAISPVFSVMWSFRNHSNMLIYYQCWNCCAA